MERTVEKESILDDRPANEGRLRFADFELDPADGALSRGGEPVPLQPQPSKLLVLLARNPHRLVRREEIRQALWGDGVHVDAEQGINFAVRKLRQALGDDAENSCFIATSRGAGYRFLREVEEVPPRHAPEVAGPAATGRAFLHRRRATAAAVAGLVAFAALFATWIRWQASPSGLPAENRPAKPPTLAVLPFLETGSDGPGEGLGAVLGEELTVLLASRFPERLGILTPSSARALDAGESESTALEGVVDYLLRGSVRHQGEEIALALRLVRTADGAHLWAGSEQLPLAEVPTRFNEIAEDVGRALPSLGAARTMDAVHDLPSGVSSDYFHGLYLIRRGDPETAAEGLELLRQVAEKAPDFPAVWEGIAEGTMAAGGDRPLGDFLPAAEAAARQALALDPQRPKARVQLASVALFLHLDWQRAGEELRRALAEQPNHQAGLHLYSLYLSYLGRHDAAIKTARKAVALDPATIYTRSDLAAILLNARRYEEAEGVARRNLEADPSSLGALGTMAAAQSLAGKKQEALATTNRFLAHWGIPPAESLKEAGAVIDAGLEAYERAHPGRPRSSIRRAGVRLLAGDPDGALAMLHRGCERPDDWNVPSIAVDPRLDDLWRMRPEARSQGCWQRSS